MPIQVLPPVLASKIAAGEVIERPSSVLKELVENALDAQAQNLKIEIEEGGRKLIRVTDDGVGISAEDAGFLFHSHATSKLTRPEDLFTISTLGFRGEALASIASVAEVTVFSRTRESEEGAEIAARGGHIAKPQVRGCAVGTSVEVRNLFYNVPVRRKFLRNPDVEYSHIYETVARLALAFPTIRFELWHDRQMIFTLPAVSDVLPRISHFFGEELAKSLVQIQTSSTEFPIAVTAYLAPPQFSKLTQRNQFIFLNGRFIRDRVLSHALTESYKELIPYGRYPYIFLFLQAKAGEVDVNVHPTKIEVRFRQVWRLHDFLVQVLRKKLLEISLAPLVKPEALSTVDTQSSTYKAIADFFTNQAPHEQSFPSTITQRHFPSEAEPFQPTQSGGGWQGGKRYFQVHDLYLIEEAEDGIVIIDQHALHERFLYEELKQQFSQGDLVRQQLLVPMVAEAEPREKILLEKHREQLHSIGIEFEDFGANSVIVRTVPLLLKEQDPVQLLKDFVDLILDFEQAKVPSSFIEEALHTVACRAAVKAGKTLSEKEIETLLQRREELEYSQTCVHGRPTSIKLTLDDLERFFRRKGS